LGQWLHASDFRRLCDARVGFGYTTSYLRSDADTQKHQQDLVKALQQII
jgi:hypothetical protein